MAQGVHVRKRDCKDGHSWQIIIEQSPCPNTGKRQRVYKSVSGVTKKQAEKIGRDMLADLENDTYLKTNSITVEKYFMEWYETYIAPQKSPTTAATYLYNIQSYIFPRFGSLKLQSLTTLEIQKWINDLSVTSPLRDRPLSPKTIRNLYMNLNAALKRAVILGYIVKNPAANVELPKCRQYKADVYSADELQQLFEVAKGTELEIGIMLLVCLGIRRGELMALTWADIDFEKKLVNIDKNTVKVKKGQSVTKDPKSESGRRVIEAPDVLINFLRQEKVAYLERRLRYGADYHNRDLVICQSNGKPYEVDYYTHKFQQLLKAHGLKKIRLHDLRHSHATYMLRLGVNVKAMQKRMGHSTFSTTMDTYSHVLDDMGREAADTLNTGLQSIVASPKSKMF